MIKKEFYLLLYGLTLAAQVRFGERHNVLKLRNRKELIVPQSALWKQDLSKPNMVPKYFFVQLQKILMI